MKKKLLFVNGHLNVGGVENSLVNVLKSIDYQYYDVDLVLFEELGNYATEVPADVNIIFYDLSKSLGPIRKCIVDNIKMRNWFALCLRFIFILEKILGVRSLSLARALFKHHPNYDCAIAYRVGFCTDFVGYIMNSKKKITWWHHGSYEYSQQQTKRLRATYEKFDRVIAVSESSKEMLMKNIPGIAKKIATVPNIINIKDILYKADQDEGVEIRSNKEITLLSIGRFSPEKGMVNCVLTCKKLIDSSYKIKWYLIGDGPQRTEIVNCIRELGLEDNIILLGAIANPYPYIKQAQIYVHPSLVESLSITVLEAFTLNTPVTVAKSMGPMEFVHNNENGLLVEPNPDGLYEGIVRLINDQNLYSRLQQDKNEVLKNYSPEVIMNKFYGLIEAG